MGKKRHRHTYKQRVNPGRRSDPHAGRATAGEWDALREDAALRDSYVRLTQELTRASALAQERASALHVPVEQVLDTRAAVRMLDEHPQLTRYLRSVAEREEATRYAMERTDLLQLAGPSGTRSPQAAYAESQMGGGWSGEKSKPIAVPNPRALRDWADRSTWVSIAKGKVRRWVERADVAVVPENEDRPCSKRAMKQIEDLLNQPNELRDSYRSLIGPVIEDILVIDRGVIEKNMNAARTPTSLYYQDGATIKIYPQWSGNPSEPRYLYDPGGFASPTVPLRNDEAIVIMESLTSWRMGYSRVQQLQDTIMADIAATESAMHLVKMKPPPHIIQLPNATSPQLETVRTRYDSEFSGRKEVMFMGGPQNMNVHSLVYSLKDQQWLEWNVYLARKIATIFGISPQDLGITFDVNRATAEVQQLQSEESGYIPLLLLLEEYLNRELVDDFAPLRAGGRVAKDALNLRLIYPEVSEAARIFHLEKILAMAQTGLAGLPSATLNQLLAMRGEEPVPGGDIFWIKTATGAVPWLAYDGAMGDYTPLSTGGSLGSQDAAGGLEESADDPSAPSDPDSAGQGATAGAGGETEGGGASGGSDAGSGTASAQKTLSAPKIPRTEARRKEHKSMDRRKPGTHWTPLSDQVRRTSYGGARAEAAVEDLTRLRALAERQEPLRQERTQPSGDGSITAMRALLAQSQQGGKPPPESYTFTQATLDQMVERLAALRADPNQLIVSGKQWEGLRALLSPPEADGLSPRRGR